MAGSERYRIRHYKKRTAADVVRLRRRIRDAGLPKKVVDRNLLVGSWNIRHLGGLYEEWGENHESPRRNLRALAAIAEVVRRLDIVAIQEVKRSTRAVRVLQRQFLGDDWGLLLSDVTAGQAGNAERLGFLFDRRRVTPTGLAGEIVVPPGPGEQARATQFARSPYLVGFSAGGQHVTLLTAHILYGDVPGDRLGGA